MNTEFVTTVPPIRITLQLMHSRLQLNSMPTNDVNKCHIRILDVTYIFKLMSLLHHYTSNIMGMTHLISHSSYHNSSYQRATSMNLHIFCVRFMHFKKHCHVPVLLFTVHGV